MTIEEVVAIAREGAALGCAEALFTLGSITAFPLSPLYLLGDDVDTPLLFESLLGILVATTSLPRELSSAKAQSPVLRIPSSTRVLSDLSKARLMLVFRLRLAVNQLANCRPVRKLFHSLRRRAE